MNGIRSEFNRDYSICKMMSRYYASVDEMLLHEIQCYKGQAMIKEDAARYLKGEDIQCLIQNQRPPNVLDNREYILNGEKLLSMYLTYDKAVITYRRSEDG